MSLHSSLQSRYPNAPVTSCQRGNCNLSLASLPGPLTVLDADKYAGNAGYTGRRCDFFVFWSHPDVRAAAVEIKGRAWKPTEVADQLRAGAVEIDRITSAAGVKGFWPVLVHEGVRDPMQLKILNRERVRFRGKDYRILRRKCGQALDP